MSIGTINGQTPPLDKYLKLEGGTMTGPLVLSGNPNSNLEAASKQYVDGITSHSYRLIDRKTETDSKFISFPTLSPFYFNLVMVIENLKVNVTSKGQFSPIKLDLLTRDKTPVRQLAEGSVVASGTVSFTFENPIVINMQPMLKVKQNSKSEYVYGMNQTAYTEDVITGGQSYLSIDNNGHTDKTTTTASFTVSFYAC